MIYIFGIVTNQIIIPLYGLLKIISYYQTLYNKKVTIDSPIESIMTFIDKYHVKNKLKKQEYVQKKTKEQMINNTSEEKDNNNDE